MKRLFSFLGKILLALMGTILPILALEIVVRVLGMAPPPVPNPNIWQSDPILGWKHQPNSGGIFYSSYNEYQTDVQINALGLRDDPSLTDYDIPAGKLRLLVLADSFGEALQVPLADTFFKQTQQRLADAGIAAQTINTGVGSYGTDQELLMFRQEGVKFHPDVTLLFFFVRNDTANSYAPLEIARNGGSVQKSYFRLDENGSLVYPAPFDPATAYQTLGLEKPKPLPPAPMLPVSDWLFLHSALYRWLAPHLADVPAVLHALGPGGLLGGEARIRATTPDIPVPFFVYQTPMNADWQSAWQLMDALIAELQSQVMASGSKFGVVIIPAKEQVYPDKWEQTLRRNPAMQSLQWDMEQPNRQLADILHRHDIPYLDLLPVFRQAAQNSPDVPLYFVHDGHWTANGHHLAGKSVFQFLVDEGWAK